VRGIAKVIELALLKNHLNRRQSPDIFPICSAKTTILIQTVMKATVFLSFVILFACGGSLSDEQRKQMREKMEMNKIVRVTEVEITEAAFAEGRRIIKTVEDLKSDSGELDSFLRINEGRVRFIHPGQTNMRDMERQLIEAYLADESNSPYDDVQKVRNKEGDFDSLLYTKPVTKKSADGSERFEGVWSIWLSKRALVLAIGRNK
jgi:hypothetical protein